jgi:hypothetical protein
LFKRGRILERGLRPLSLILPFPAIDVSGWLQIYTAGKGIQEIGMEKHQKANRTIKLMVGF